jgi:hypothetical protein
MTLRASADSIGSRSSSKEPVLQLFVMPVGLPQRRGLHVSIIDGDASSAPLATTSTSDRRDPLFSDPLELWGRASGKDASLPLTFAVMAEGSDFPIAVAKINSDELRRFGLFNPREGAAVALPLTPPEGDAEGAGTGDSDAGTPSTTREPNAPLPSLHGAADAVPMLHCYVHVGYSVRREGGRPGARLSGASALGGGGGGGGGEPSADGRRRRSSGSETVIGAPPRGRTPLLRTWYAVRPAAEPLGVLLRVALVNASTRRAVRLDHTALAPPPPWTLVAALPSGEGSAEGSSHAVLPPRGRCELTFLLRWAAGGDDCDSGGGGVVRTGMAPPLPPAPAATGTEGLHHGGAAELSIRYACVPVHAAAGDAGEAGSAGEGAAGEGAAGEGATDAGAAGGASPMLVVRRIPLPPSLLAPLVVVSHALTPPPRVGERSQLCMTLAWPALRAGRRESAASPLARRDSDGAESAWLVEIEVEPSADWLVLGAQRRRLRLRVVERASFSGEANGCYDGAHGSMPNGCYDGAAADGVGHGIADVTDDADGSAASAQLDFHVVPLAAGQLVLPTLRITRLTERTTDAAADGLPLPSPPYLGGSTALVAR